MDVHRIATTQKLLSC